MGTVMIPATQLARGETKIIETSLALKRSGIEQSILTAGLEFEYTGVPGSVVMSAQSASRDGNHAFLVPMWDILAQRSSTGGYPWSIDGDSSTRVYIKNVTDKRQKYVLHIKAAGGDFTYTPGVQFVEPGQTVTLDVRRLRDEQIPDESGNQLPLDATSGQIHWSVRSTDRLPLIGRSEQVDIAHGLSSSYACQNCCGDGFADGWLEPGSIFGSIGGSGGFRAREEYNSCYGGTVVGNASVNIWRAIDPAVVSMSATGYATATASYVGTGETQVEAEWTAFYTFNIGQAPEYPECASTEETVTREAPVEVSPQVRVTSTSICEDRISINLSPANVTGYLEVFLDGPNGSQRLAFRDQVGGDTREYFYTQNLPNQEFTKIRATWRVNNMTVTGTLDYRMRVLGDYLNTCYNTSLEADFSGSSVNAGITAGPEACLWSSRNFIASFLSAVNLNGSGVDSGGAGLQPEGICRNPPPSSPAYNGRRYRRPTDIRTSCRSVPRAGITVASPSIACGTPIFINGLGCKVVDDIGGGLATDQLDNYGGVGRSVCSNYPNLRRKTVQLF